MAKRFRIHEPDIDHVDPNKDIPKVHEFLVFNNKLIIEKSGPHGFHRIRYERGVTPYDLLGDWMGVEEAKKAIRRYFAKLGKPEQIEGKI